MSDVASEYLSRPEDESSAKPEPAAAKDAPPLRLGEFDPLASNGADTANPQHDCEPGTEGQTAREKKPRKPLVEFYSPSQLRAYAPPENQCLVGDFHLQRGAPSVLAGPPGVGKSLAATTLGVLGARGEGNWLGMAVHCHFKTMIVQSENGLTRLHRDFEQIPDMALDEWIRVSAFPSYRGFEFTNPFFRADLKAALKDFGPQLVIVDPWNNVTRDTMEKDYLEAFERLREVMAEVPEAACLILHHLRKPRSEDRHRGRSLANLLSGSYVLVSFCRSVMVMQPASDDTEDVRVVITPAKNNDGELGARTAWARKAGWFEPVPEFNFEEFDSGNSKREPKVNEGHIQELFGNGHNNMKKSRAAERLQEIADVGRSAAYEALMLEDGRFSHLLVEDPDTGFIGLKPAESEPPTETE